MISRLVLLVAMLATAAAIASPALAKPKSTKDAGIVACYIWCNDHNKTTKSIIVCENQCDKYYGPVVNPGPAAPPS